MIKKLLKNQRGEGTLTLPILIFIVSMVLYMGIDFFGIYATYQKLKITASETLTLMKIENGWDIQTENYFNEMLNKVGLDRGEIYINNVTPAKVQRGDAVTIEISTEYEVRSIKPLGKEPKIPLTVKLSGLAQSYVR